MASNKNTHLKQVSRILRELKSLNYPPQNPKSADYRRQLILEASRLKGVSKEDVCLELNQPWV